MTRRPARHEEYSQRGCARALTLAAILAGLGLTIGGCGANDSVPTKEADLFSTEGENQLSDADVRGRDASARSTRMKFVDRAAEAGIRFTVRNGEEAGQYAILESLGAGVSLIDVDADGQLDVVIPGGGLFSDEGIPTGLPFGLFRQRESWSFEDCSQSSMLTVPASFSHGISVADFDSDGFSDLLVTGFRELLLFRNNGDGTFSDVTESTQLVPTGWSTGSALADFNGDGVIDVFIVNYVDWSPENNPPCAFGGHRDVCSPKHFEAESDSLWFGDGSGRFSLADDDAGLEAGGKGLAVLAADFDLDGDVDLYVANDTTPNFLYWNDGSGHFEEAGIPSGTALGDPAEADGSMGVAVGDLNHDGLPDLWVANYERQSFALYRNEGSGLFQHVSSVSGITSVGQSYVGFGTVIEDFDLDGDQDIAVANGHVMQHSINSPVRQRPLLFENEGRSQFHNVAAQAGEYFATDHVGRGMSAGDIDGDGDVDLVVSHSNSPVAVLENRCRNEDGVLRVRLVGTSGCRDAVGALVTVTAGNAQWQKQVSGGGSYLAASDRTMVFGGWKASASISIRVDWPGGARIEKSLPHADETVILVEGSLDRDTASP
jgi:enediyne biosynthesis protein E4